MTSKDPEAFTLVSTHLYESTSGDYVDFTSHKVADGDIQMIKCLREHYPGLCVTVVPESNAPLIDFAAAGFAHAKLDTETDSIFRWRGYVSSSHRGGSGQLGDAVFFGKYHYTWSNTHYILYTVANASIMMQYILKEPDTANGETTLTNCAATDTLITACAEASLGNETDFVYVYDEYWDRSRSLWKEVQRASWDDVILDPKMKKALTSVTKNFFDSKELYQRYGVPWKRGLIFYGPPGNGKTISIKALMKELSVREKDPIPTLYVKSAPDAYDIGAVFSFARTMTPCLLILEDVETIVTSKTRSYFFNEVDGLGNNDGILMVASTNYLDRLDSGLSKRPSRFDRKYKFPLPNLSERADYAEYWRQKLDTSNPAIEFPKKLCKAIAEITDKFSFAYMQEAFIASLLMLARDEQDDEGGEEIADDGEEWSHYRTAIKAPKISALEDNGKDDSLDKYKLWRAMKVNVKMLRKDLENDDDDGDNEDEDDTVAAANVSEGYRVDPRSKDSATYPDQIANQFRFLNIGDSKERQASSQNRVRGLETEFGLETTTHARRRSGPSRRAPARFAPALPPAEETSHFRASRNLRQHTAESKVDTRLGTTIPQGLPSARALYIGNMSRNLQSKVEAGPTSEQMEDAGLYKAKSLTEAAFQRI